MPETQAWLERDSGGPGKPVALNAPRKPNPPGKDNPNKSGCGIRVLVIAILIIFGLIWMYFSS